LRGVVARGVDGHGGRLSRRSLRRPRARVSCGRRAGARLVRNDVRNANQTPRAAHGSRCESKCGSDSNQSAQREALLTQRDSKCSQNSNQTPKVARRPHRRCPRAAHTRCARFDANLILPARREAPRHDSECGSIRTAQRGAAHSPRVERAAAVSRSIAGRAVRIRTGFFNAGPVLPRLV